MSLWKVVLVLRLEEENALFSLGALVSDVEEPWRTSSVARLARGRPRGFLVVGSVVALPDARLLARAARVSTIARRASRAVDAPQSPTWRAKCRRVTPTYRRWSDYRREFMRGLNTEVTRSLT